MSKRMEEWIESGNRVKRITGIYPPGWATVLHIIKIEEGHYDDTFKKR